ncbi:MAG: L,D-transpeptidase [Anaerolineales bacterium]|nr:L,D-transpeptidase [Anaerolineales bacterium]
MSSISRKSFLKLCMSGLLGMGFSSRTRSKEGYFQLPGPIGRIASDEKEIFIYQKPDEESDVVRKTSFDELINIYYQKEILVEEDHYHTWYRVWGGYLPGSYVQPTYYQLNKPLKTIPECGQLAEITVPFTQSFKYHKHDGWERYFRLYYGTTHWVTGKRIGPDQRTWYKITSEWAPSLYYFVPQEHLRPIPDAEYIPLSIDVPPHEKRVEVSLIKQKMIAYESNKPVKTCSVSTGLGYEEVPDGTATPLGSFDVTSKHPTRHMGGLEPGSVDEIPGGYALPGVPWATFFISETGVAFHGTYWHNNFGHRMSHGCINMKTEDAKWLFRWVDPPYDPPYRDHCNWETHGRGTSVIIYN